jgi:hypothetical protein
MVGRDIACRSAVGPDGNINMRWSIDEMANLMPIDISPGAIERQDRGTAIMQSASKAIARADAIIFGCPSPAASQQSRRPPAPLLTPTPSWAVTASPGGGGGAPSPSPVRTTAQSPWYNQMSPGMGMATIPESWTPPSITVSAATVDASTQSDLSFPPDDTVAIESGTCPRRIPTTSPCSCPGGTATPPPSFRCIAISL